MTSMAGNAFSGFSIGVAFLMAMLAVGAKASDMPELAKAPVDNTDTAAEILSDDSDSD